MQHFYKKHKLPGIVNELINRKSMIIIIIIYFHYFSMLMSQKIFKFASAYESTVSSMR